MADITIIIAFLYGSVLFCWLAAEMAAAGQEKISFKVARPEIQANAGIILFSALFAAGILYKFVIRDRIAPAEGTADLVFSCAVIAAAAAAGAVFGDRPGALGLPLRNWHVTLIFLVPAVAAALLPGGAVNWRLLLKALTPVVFISGFAEEFLFRGYLQTRFQAAWGNARGLMAAALAATVYRLPMLSGADAVTIISATVLHFIVWGLVAGLIYARIGNIYGLVVLRVFWDVAALALAGFAIE